MKIVDFNDTTHEFTLIPRSNEVASVKVDIYDETTKETTGAVLNSYTITDGIATINFDFTFEDKKRYQIKVYITGKVLFRGKIVATTQETQDYKLTEDLYFYE